MKGMMCRSILHLEARMRGAEEGRKSKYLRRSAWSGSRSTCVPATRVAAASMSGEWYTRVMCFSAGRLLPVKAMVIGG